MTLRQSNNTDNKYLSFHSNKKSNMKEQTLPYLITHAPHEALTYAIYDQSSQSGSYHPRNICVNEPTEQSSRWSSGSHDQSQFITIKLDKPAVACEILFGKFHRSHVCNLKEFKVFGGLDPLNMNELLHKGLTDDNKTESFPLIYKFNDLIFPIQYIKIVPLATFGANFNYSIWYVEIRGIKDDELMSKVYDAYTTYKEMETIRLCLKHFRLKNMMDVYQTLKNKTGIEIEHASIADLHQSLVIDGNFEQAEKIIADADSNNVFTSFAENAMYTPTWQKIDASNDDGDSPCARGGHQLCIDTDREKIYLLGGWDGKVELSDFWCYHIKENRWKLLSSDTSIQGGPSARSCHTMCFDPVRKSIYVLGKYIEFRPTTTPDPTAYESEFYQYYTELDRWIQISESTKIDGGPPLLFHHEMCVDPIGRKLYVFGGRILALESAPSSYSGFYSFDIDKSVWKTLRYDVSHLPIPTATLRDQIASLDPALSRTRASSGSYIPTSHTIKSRSGHSMLLDSKNRKIYIFGGQRAKECLKDLYCYSIDQDKITSITQDFSKNIGPESGYTQRGAIDIERQELHISLGFFQNKPTNIVRNCFWVYSIKNNTWEEVFSNDNHDTIYWNRMKLNEPYPRYTHQMVYNPKTNAHFIFGGHPGDVTDLYRRLDDFWELRLTKPNSGQIMRRCLYLIRTRKLYELCKQAERKLDTSNQVSADTLYALDYLRKYVTPLVNGDSKDELNHFKKLCAHLCLSEDNLPKNGSYKTKQEVYFSERTTVFQSLLDFFPTSMKEPKGTLVDAVKIS
ncbi:hypothetical protein HPULCUR_011722 [Helicostylum pulchrum]|uniref:Muskelin N-terminal domain-containing protein n=1 Tax=Helicostylum pulchrum TaxID=562976 RepID=A0ABP9YGW4_9FUNG